eukprot:TRINITY_DN62951_c0_g1_i1.p1 TRINITY_DN62951_c0_g1~~TRINITY_DN62951_c0_g1_i1.p1  ORF type:complete len:426 (+),score=84.15 TRINITY_DN62951_c0_g1_i1:127-1404(+)
MGAILSEPVTAMVVERCSSPHWAAAAVTMQGWRRTHEDAHILCSLQGATGSEGSPGVFAVLDGHGGQAAAAEGSSLLEERLKEVALVGTLAPAEASRKLEEVFIDCDSRLRQNLQAEDRSGSTVVASVITQPKPDEYCVHLAHAGDSRAVLYAGGRLHCSQDHKPNREDETRRIEAAGGSVSQGPLGGGPMRVDGALAVSRALGDFHFKPAGMDPAKCKVSAVPEVQTIEGCLAGDWLLLACDGVFDVMENEEVRDFVEARISKSGSEPVDGGEVMVDLLKHCLDKGSKDNCTACLIQLGYGFAARSNTVELRQGMWEKASPDVKNKYAEFFIAHGFEAEARTLNAQSSSSARRPPGGPSRATQAAGPAASGGSGAAASQPPGQQMAALTRALQAIRSTRAIQAAWRARQTGSSSAKDGASVTGR